MEYSKAFMDRVQLFRDAVNFKHTSKAPHLAQFYTWKIHDSEFSFKEALTDSKKMSKVVCDFVQRYDFDAHSDLGTRNPLNLANAMGEGSSYIFDENSEGLNVVDMMFIEPEDYKLCAKDVDAFYKEMFKRKYPHGDSLKVLNAMNELMAFGQYTNKITDIVTKTYERPLLKAMKAAVLVPIENFNSAGRGIKGISLDMRRHEEDLLAALNALFEARTLPQIQGIVNSDTSAFAIDAYTALLAYAVMTPAQFEKFYWIHLKPYADAMQECGKQLYAYCESSMLRFKDFFADYPKGVICIHPETDSVFDVRASLPNAAIAGGMPTYTLGRSTPQDCVDTAKRIIDTMGDGFIFSQDKMISFKNDCNRENLLAVCNFVKDYRI